VLRVGIAADREFLDLLQGNYEPQWRVQSSKYAASVCLKKSDSGRVKSCLADELLGPLVLATVTMNRKLDSGRIGYRRRNNIIRHESKTIAEIPVGTYSVAFQDAACIRNRQHIDVLPVPVCVDRADAACERVAAEDARYAQTINVIYTRC
jgi:hypothetical protein